MKREEEKIQIEVVRHLKTRAVPGVIYWHSPNGGKMHPARGARLKSMGVRSGVSDIIAYHKGEAFALELKAPKGRPTEEQLEFLSDWRAAGGHGVVAHGQDEALAVLEAWGLLRRAS